MLDKSEENWLAGEQCLNDGRLNAAANRFYYSVFQAVLTYASAKRDYHQTREAKVHTDMGQLVKTVGKKSVYYGRIFVDLRSLRETADYQPDTPLKGKIEELLPPCKRIRTFFLEKARV